MRIISAFMFIVAVVCFPCSLLAGEEDETSGMKTLAVQNREHSMTHEFGVWFGTLPLDAFEKGIAFSGAYTLHFDDLLAWEIAQFTYSYGIETDLKEDLENLPQPTGPTPFETVQYFVTSSVMFKPIYGKLAALNQALIYSEMFFVLGGGYGWLTVTDRPVIDVGAGMRIYAGSVVSFRIDVRDYMFVNLDDLHNELWVALGLALGF